jgi:glutamine synthetase
MPISQRIRRILKTQQVEFVDLKFVDMVGRWHHLTLPARRLKETLFTRGVGVDGSSLGGFRKVKAGDMVLIPDPGTALIDPICEQRTLSFIGSVHEVGAASGYSRDPRSVALRAEAHLARSGVADASWWGPELEFYLFNAVSYHQGVNKAYFFIDCEEAEWENGEEPRLDPGYKIQRKGGYHIAPPLDRTHDLRSRIVSLLEGCDIPVKYHHHEVGGAGQVEVELMFDTLTRTADRIMWAKYLIKDAARKTGLSATFMPKPLFEEPGNGLHFHQYLSRRGKPVFHGTRAALGLSPLARHYMGGLMKHMPSLLAWTNPSTNSYRRLVPGFEAPDRIAYSVANRTSSIRIPGYATDPREKRIEFRPPDATCNAYLAMAAMLMAGLDGIRHKTEPGPPMDKNIHELSPRELQRIPQLPVSLDEALDALARDHEYLTEGEVFSRDLIKAWITLKRRNEIKAVQLRPHPWEFCLYYDL